MYKHIYAPLKYFVALLLVSVCTQLSANIAGDSIIPLSQLELIKLLAQRPDSLDQLPNLVHPNIKNRCAQAYNYTDDYTGRQTIGLHNSTLFTYTPKQYKKFLKGKEFIRCEGHISYSTGKLYVLNIKITIESEAATENLGNIPAGAYMLFEPIGGKAFYVNSFKGAKATVENNKTYYKCSFVLDKKAQKQLKTAAISQIKIVFDKKKQTFNVFDLDVLSRQMKCFED